ncbi:PTPLA-domain-containing protein [Astrocystis sublimbata]|nr:PTPLA-domain-containing protein [Astrocystis sublimbata]
MTLKTRYLLLYNGLSLLAWTLLTALVVLHIVADDSNNKALLRSGGSTTTRLLTYLTILQSTAILEIAHAALGLVRASPGPAALQVGGRNLVVWTVMNRFPELILGDNETTTTTMGRVGFLGCLLAWGCSDVLRYAFFVAQLGGGGGADGGRLGTGSGMNRLRWLRYTAFIPLYPIGFLSEASLVYLALVEGESVRLLYRAYLLLGLLSYFPASYILYTYMLSQRRRVLGQVA